MAKKWVRGVREGGFALDPPSQHSLAQGGEGGKDAFWILVAAKRVPHKIWISPPFLGKIQGQEIFIIIQMLH